MKSIKFSKKNKEYLILFGLPLIIILIFQFLGFNGLYGQDSYEYLRYSKAIRIYFVEGLFPGKFYWPVLYPFLGAVLSFVFNDIIFSLHFLTSFSLSICCIYTLKIINLLYKNNKYSFYYVLIFGLLSPYFLRQGLVIMSDIMASMFIVLSFYFYLKSETQTGRLKFVFVFATAAFMTRYPSIIICLPIVISSLYLVFKKKAFLLFFYAALISVIICVPFIILQWNYLFEVSNNYFLNVWSFGNFFKSSYTSIDGLQSHRFVNIIYVLYVFFHPGFIFIGFVLSLFSFRKIKKKHKILLLSITVYLLFLAGIPFQNPRVLGLIFPFVLIFLFSAYNNLIEKLKCKFLFYVVAISIQLVLTIYSFKTIYKLNQVEQNNVLVINKLSNKKDIYTSGYEGALRCYSNKNVISLWYDSIVKNKRGLLFINEMEMKNNSFPKTLNYNYNKLKNDTLLHRLKTFNKGWVLYELQ